MPKSIGNVSEVALKQIPLPTSHSKQYAVVSHGYIIDLVKNELENKGLEIDTEIYRATHDGEVAQGVYHIKYGNDPELGLMFAWCNSYNKTMRFKCAVGAHVFVCGNGLMIGDMGNYTKKHYGDSAKVKALVKDHIETQIASADNFYNMLQKDKEAMKLVCLSEKEIAELMGCIFFEDIITINQLSIAKKQYEKPDHDYNAERNALWSVYNHITFALKTSHPKNWMDQQAGLHKYVVKTYLEEDLTQSVDPNQINIVDQIDEIENEDSNDQLIDREITPSPLECSKPEEPLPLDTGKPSAGQDEDGLFSYQEDIDDAPEITGIPDGNTLSDTDDNEEIIEEREEEAEESELTFEDYMGSEDADLAPLHDTEAELNVDSEEVIEEEDEPDLSADSEVGLVEEDSDEGKLELPDFEF